MLPVGIPFPFGGRKGGFSVSDAFGVAKEWASRKIGNREICNTAAWDIAENGVPLHRHWKNALHTDIPYRTIKETI